MCKNYNTPTITYLSVLSKDLSMVQFSWAENMSIPMLILYDN